MRSCDNCGVNHDELSACDEQDVEDRMYELRRDEVFERNGGIER